MNFKYIIDGILEVVKKPNKMFRQPNIILERIFFGLDKTIKKRIYKTENDTSYINLYGYKFAISSNLHIFTEFMNELYPFLTADIIESIIPEKSYIDVKNGFTIKEGDYVIDAGASLGFFSIPTSKKVGKMGKVFAFEPLDQVRNLLEKSRQENSLDNLFIVSYALGDKEEIGFFELSDQYGTASRINDNQGSKEKTQKVFIKSIDKYVEECQIEKIDFIKMDIEGFERFAIKGAKNVIKAFKPKLSICTYHLPDDEKIITDIIKNIDPSYKFIYKSHKLLAY
jgi:FkbM family methyltransferase